MSGSIRFQSSSSSSSSSSATYVLPPDAPLHIQPISVPMSLLFGERPIEKKIKELVQAMFDSCQTLASEKQNDVAEMLFAWRREFVMTYEIDRLMDPSSKDSETLDRAIYDLYTLQFHLENVATTIAAGEGKIIWRRHLESLHVLMQNLLGERPLEKKITAVVQAMFDSCQTLASEKQNDVAEMLFAWRREFVMTYEVNRLLDPSSTNSETFDEAIYDLCTLHFNLEYVATTIAAGEEKIIWSHHLESLRLCMQELLGEDSDIEKLCLIHKARHLDIVAAEQGLELIAQANENLTQESTRLDQEMSAEATRLFGSAWQLQQEHSDSVDRTYEETSRLLTEVDRVSARMNAGALPFLELVGAELKKQGKDAARIGQMLGDTLNEVKP